MEKTYYLITESGKGEIISKAIKKYVRHSIIQSVAAVIVLIALYAMWGFPGLTELMVIGERLVLWAAFIVIVILVIAVILLYRNHMNRLRQWLKKMPKGICIADDRVTIDNHIYFYEELKQIRATPPAYQWKSFYKDKGGRMLAIIDNNNEKSTYFLGIMPLSGFYARTFISPMMFEKIMFKDYEELCEILRQVLIDRGAIEKFVWDLENF